MNSLTNADNILVYNTASTDVEMANLGVAHEALRQAHGGRRSLKLGVSILDLSEAIHHRTLRIGNGIAILGRLLSGHTPTVNDD